MSNSLPLPALLALCRALRHGTGAGLTLVRVFRQQSRSGSADVRPLAGRVADRLEAGSALGDALRAEPALPALFVDLVTVGEEAGSLDIVLPELENYHEREHTLRRQFWSAVTLPLVQFVAGVVVVAVTIVILGWIADSRGQSAGDPLGFGLSGVGGAVLFVFGVVGLVGVPVLAFWLIRRSVRGTVAADRLVLAVPAIGPALHSLALARFALGLQLTTEAGLSVPKAVRRACLSAGNAAFADAADRLAKGVRKGRELSAAMRPTGLFPEEFLAVVSHGEETGQLPEVLARHGAALQEEAGRRLKMLVMVGSGAVWFLVVAFIVVMIFRMAGTYLGAIGGLGA